MCVDSDSAPNPPKAGSHCSNGGLCKAGVTAYPRVLVQRDSLNEAYVVCLKVNPSRLLCCLS